MIAVLKPGTDREQCDSLCRRLREQGIEVEVAVGRFRTLLCLIGDTSGIDIGQLESSSCVETVKRISEPFYHADRSTHQRSAEIKVGRAALGNGSFALIAGPCSVESEAQICAVAEQVKEAGAGLLRGGAFKPRTSPYDFQGLRAEGIRLLLEAGRRSALPVVTEIMSVNDLPLFEQVDVLQVGARNMQNFDLLRELGHLNKPILLKRGMGNTLKELLLSAEYIMSGGNEQVILCERGIRSFEPSTRNTLDLSAVPLLHQLSQLPVIVDPSHGTGRAELVEPMALAPVAAGADGLMIEVHNDPPHALSDGVQALTPRQFIRLSQRVERLREALAE